MTREPRRPSRFARAALATVTAIACMVPIAVAPATASVDRARHGRPTALPVLMGSVGPGFEIKISDRSVPAGKYKLVVRDKATIHNFHILGPGVDKATTIVGTGKEVYRIKLKPGRYTIQCDPHQFTMFTKLRVT